MSSPIIETVGLGKIFLTPLARKRVTAISDVSLAVHEGEAFGFVGPNGAGKSTTIKILMGSLTPTSGYCRLNGLDTALPQSRARVGYVPESPYLYDYLSPLEILETGCELHGIREGDRRAYCMGWLEKFSLGSVATRRLRTFSKGMAQRTALAYALAVRPRLLVLDEPLSGLDPVGRKEVIDILMEYRLQGGSIFFSSHVLYDVERLADRFGLIHQGRLTTVQSPAELVGGNPRMVVRSVGGATVPGMTPDTSGRWHAEIDQDQLWPLLDELRRAGHLILEVRPSISLETAFMRYVKGDGNGEPSTDE